mgnify:CR=1 FL=1
MSNNNDKMKVHYMSKSNEWATPQDFFDRLDEEFRFTLDPATDGINAKCDKFYTQEDDGLSQDWGGEHVFMNPPYGRAIKDWVKKASEEGSKPNTKVVALIPSRTDTRYWHDYIFGVANEVRFVKGRLKFGDGKNSAPFPSAVVIWDGDETFDGTTRMTTMKNKED